MRDLLLPTCIAVTLHLVLLGGMSMMSTSTPRNIVPDSAMNVEWMASSTSQSFMHSDEPREERFQSQTRQVLTDSSWLESLSLRANVTHMVDPNISKQRSQHDTSLAAFDHEVSDIVFRADEQHLNTTDLSDVAVPAVSSSDVALPREMPQSLELEQAIQPAIREITSRAQPVSIISDPQPEYPVRARRLQLSGTVILRGRVQADGKITELQVAQSSGHDSLDRAALNGVRDWKFQPAKDDKGNAVSAPIEIPIEFRLQV